MACEKLVYHVIRNPGWYTSMSKVDPFATFEDRDEAIECASEPDREHLGVIAVDPSLNWPPFLGHDLDSLHESHGVELE